MKQKSDRRKRKVQIKKAAALLFLAMLAVICLVNLVHRDKEFSQKENRMLEQKPAFTLSGVTGGRYMKQYESYKSDQFAARDLWVSLKTNVDLLMGRRDSNGVFKGKKNYLLEDIAKPNEEQLEENIEAIRAFEQSYVDIPVYFALVPNAANVMSDKLPALAETEAQEKQFENIRKELGGKINWVDVQKVLKKHRNEDIYYHTDHHWTTLGASYAYEELAKAMGLDTANGPKWEKYTVSNDFNGTLSATSGYEQGYREPIHIYVPEKGEKSPDIVLNYVDEQKKTASLYDASKLKEKDQYAMFLGGNHAVIDLKTTAASTERLLLVKDSYANCLVPFLTPFFREIIIIDPRYYYGDIHQVMEENKITDILFLYNGNTFVEDNSISGVLKNNETE
ncbi:DHHW family protein [[Clostridium] hylemonae]|uniref:DHHW protein n=1 Tax=[Clostridium] hylemonae DSM 15053 TaxID=553973 RepID=C0BZU5_9FIRM|nr:DHHW family protein [[Clostridium] hylemonae]EEG74673.1 hypothetical protein CLOHYLEM_05337 [[Clostridium] hylemonae DSM 15053]QEK18695.1 hypothetical protein LAJLEIBI_02715 [[Clostridium] hylemonae DSM 15053]